MRRWFNATDRVKKGDMTNPISQGVMHPEAEGRPTLVIDIIGKEGDVPEGSVGQKCYPAETILR